jgi:hypothetical protein
MFFEVVCFVTVFLVVVWWAVRKPQSATPSDGEAEKMRSRASRRGGR